MQTEEQKLAQYDKLANLRHFAKGDMLYPEVPKGEAETIHLRGIAAYTKDLFTPSAFEEGSAPKFSATLWIPVRLNDDAPQQYKDLLVAGDGGRAVARIISSLNTGLRAVTKKIPAVAGTVNKAFSEGVSVGKPASKDFFIRRAPAALEGAKPDDGLSYWGDWVTLHAKITPDKVVDHVTCFRKGARMSREDAQSVVRSGSVVAVTFTPSVSLKYGSVSAKLASVTFAKFPIQETLRAFTSSASSASAAPIDDEDEGEAPSTEPFSNTTDDDDDLPGVGGHGLP